MDAISFVLGIQAQTLRGKQLKDLIYRLEGKEPAKGARASVCSRLTRLEMCFFRVSPAHDIVAGVDNVQDGGRHRAAFPASHQARWHWRVHAA